MSDEPRYLLTFACALGSGIIGGVFFAFSTFVMKALGRLPATQGIAAMQSINVVVLNPWFLGVFLGTALGSAVLTLSLFRGSMPGAEYLVAGSASYILGTFFVTLRCNVPWNNKLAAVDPASGAAAEVWNSYLSRWMAWNHVRTIAALMATFLFICGL